MRRIVVVFLLTVFSSGVFAVFKTGYDLEKERVEYEKRELGNSHSTFDFATYTGYVFGVTDLGSEAGLICFPEMDTIKGKQIFTIVGNYLKNNPEKWGDSASIIVLNALANVYPCPKPKPAKKEKFEKEKTYL
jgi:hypothetical protein